MMLDAPTQTYVDVAATIQSVVRAFHAKYGHPAAQELSLDELTGIANLAFANHYRTHTPPVDAKPGTFGRWIARVVNLRLHDARRRRARRHRIAAQLPLPEGGAVAESSFDVSAFVRDMTDDARTVLHLVFDVTPHVEEDRGTGACRVRGRWRGFAWIVKRTVYGRLRGLGWAVARIAESFREIKEAL